MSSLSDLAVSVYLSLLSLTGDECGVYATSKASWDRPQIPHPSASDQILSLNKAHHQLPMLCGLLRTVQLLYFTFIFSSTKLIDCHILLTWPQKKKTRSVIQSNGAPIMRSNRISSFPLAFIYKALGGPSWAKWAGDLFCKQTTLTSSSRDKR